MWRLLENVSWCTDEMGIAMEEEREEKAAPGMKAVKKKAGGHAKEKERGRERERRNEGGSTLARSHYSSLPSVSSSSISLGGGGGR